MGYSEIVSTAAFLLAFLIALQTWRWDRVVVSVEGSQWLGGVGTAATDRISFCTEIVSKGNHTTQIIDAFWQVERGELPPLTIPALHGGGGIESLFQKPNTPEDPVFPLSLERNHRLTWDFEMPLNDLREPQTVTRMRPAVTVMSRRRKRVVYGPWKRPQLS